MAQVARASGTDAVFSLTGSGFQCLSPINTVTGDPTTNCFVNGIPVVVEGDIVGLHPASGCSTDLSPLTTFSPSVFINGKRVGRLGDQYTSDNTIISGSANVFCG